MLQRFQSLQSQVPATRDPRRRNWQAEDAPHRLRDQYCKCKGPEGQLLDSTASLAFSSGACHNIAPPQLRRNKRRCHHGDNWVGVAVGGGGRKERARAEDARDEQGHGKDGTTDVDRRRRRGKRDDPIVDVAGERWRNNLTAVVSLLSGAGRTASPSPPTGSGGAFFVVPPAATVLEANTAEDNKDDCACVEDAHSKRGCGEDASRDRGRQQEEAPAEEGQPDCRHRGGAAAR
jgi:hypothetical protein